MDLESPDQLSILVGAGITLHFITPYMCDSRYGLGVDAYYHVCVSASWRFETESVQRNKGTLAVHFHIVFQILLISLLTKTTSADPSHDYNVSRTTTFALPVAFYATRGDFSHK